MGLRRYLTKRIVHYLMQPTHPPRLSFFDYKRMCDELRPGDVILVEGRNRNSKIIKHITFSPWTHAALYVGPIHKIQDDTLRAYLKRHYTGYIEDPIIIESLLGEGTLIHPLKRYQHEHMRICRPIGLAHDDAEKIIHHASQHLGGKYNLRRFIDLGRFLLKSRLFPRLWRSTLLDTEINSQSTREICSTMLAAAFGSIDFPILPLIDTDEEQKKISLIRRNPRLYTPSDFDFSPYFNIIKYPIFKLSRELNTGDLPWDNTREYNDELGCYTTKKISD